MRFAPILAIVLVAARASAHIVPVPDSTCAFDPLTIEVPAEGVVGTATPASPADSFRIQYRVAESTALFDLSNLPPRGFIIIELSSTVTLPSFVVASLRNDGNLTATLPLQLDLGSGIGTFAIAATMTSGLVMADGAVLEGTAL